METVRLFDIALISYSIISMAVKYNVDKVVKVPGAWTLAYLLAGLVMIRTTPPPL